MKRRWTLIRDRALVLQATGIPYDQAFQMATREIPEGATAPAATVANAADTANLAARHQLKADAKKAFDQAVDDTIKRTGRPRSEVYNECFLQCANITHAQLFNEANEKLPPPPTTPPGTHYSDGRGYAPAGADTTLPYPPWLKHFGEGVSNNTNGQGVSWVDIERLKLPVDCSPEEMAAAKSCGSEDPMTLFDCLAKWLSQSRSISLPSATCIAMGRYQKLARGLNIPTPQWMKMAGTPAASI